MTQPPAQGSTPNTVGFFISSLFAFVGGHVMNYSVILYSQDILGSTALAGVAFFLCFFPPLLLGLLAGVLCDQHSTKTLIGAAQGVFMLAAACLLAMRLTDAPPAVARLLILTTGLLNGIAWSFVAPARLASLGRLVPSDRLGHVSVLFNLVVMVGFGLAPIVIGLTTSRFGWTATFGVAFGLFTLAQITLPLVRMWWDPAPRARTVAGELKAGMRYLHEQPLLRHLLALGLAVFLTMGPVQVIWPRLATQTLGLDEAGRGWYLGSLAGALILGGILAGALRPRVHHGRSILIGTALIGAAVMAMPFVSWRPGALALLVGAGTVAGFVVSFIVAGLQTGSHETTRGRVISFYTITSQVGPASAGLLSGLIADAAGLEAGFVVMGGVITAAAIAAALAFTELQRFAGEPPPAD